MVVIFIRRNVNVCLIGSSGAGKSTLTGHLQLLVRSSLPSSTVRVRRVRAWG
jgi:ABC-type phosphate/phosphonate transport system ATPase subunit